MGMPRKKPSAPSVPKPTDKLDPNRWKKAALRALGQVSPRPARVIEQLGGQ
jgi:hypothetical protein